MKRLCPIVWSLLAILLAGCEPEERALSPSQPTPELGGTWTLVEYLHSTSGELEWDQDGNRLSGVFRSGDSGAVYDCSGIVSGNNITFTLIRPEWGGSLNFSGQAGPNGMSGTLTDRDKNKGRWTASRMD